MVELGPEFDLKTSRIGGHDVVVVKGEIDMATAPTLDKALSKFSKKEVFLDLRKTDFMDSAGLKVLITQRSRIEESGGVMRLRGRRRSRHATPRARRRARSLLDPTHNRLARRLAGTQPDVETCPTTQVKQGQLGGRGANLLRLSGEDDVVNTNRVPVRHPHEQGADRHILLEDPGRPRRW